MIAYYSSLAMVTSALIYGLALVAHAAEWAAARRLEPAVEQVPVPVGAGAPVASLATRRRPAAADPGLRVEQFGRAGVALTIVGVGVHVSAVVMRGLAANRFPWGNMYEFVTAATAVVVIAYLVLATRFGMRWLGLPVTMVAVVGQGLAVTVFYVAIAPLVPALHSVWFIVHIVAAIVAGAAFNVGGAASLLFLLRDRAERRGVVRGYLARLPRGDTIDTLAYRCHAFAFPLWTFAVAAGAVWAQYAWGRFWGWDPKETWALITWVVYAGYLHARATAGWRGRRAARVALVGLAAFWFNFIGINLLVSGLHSYAGI